MRKNVASQKIGAQMVSATDGSAFTGAVTVYVTVDAGTQGAGSVGSGACTHEGNGYHTYAPAQAETNGNLIAFTFIGTGAIPQTVQVETVSFDPHDTVRLALTALPNAAADAAGGLPISDAGGLDLDAQRADVAAILVDTGTTLDGRIPAALVGGRMDSSVGAMAANVITAAATAADFGTEIAAAVWDAATSGMSTVGSIGKKLADWTIHSAADVWSVATRTLTAATNITSTGGTTVPQTGDSYARIGAPTGASISADLLSMRGATFDTSTDSLEAIRDRGDAAWGAGSSAEFLGTVAKSGSTYYVSFLAVQSGAIVASGSLSSLVCAIYDEDGTDLTFSGTPAAGSNNVIYASGTLGTAITDNRPVIVKVGATISGTAYTGVLAGVNIA